MTNPIESGWAPAEMSPPPQYTDLLVHVTFPNEIMVRPKMMVAFMDGEGVWRACSIRVSGVVTHWMPLPPAPA